jgi:hypothetical protein
MLCGEGKAKKALGLQTSSSLVRWVALKVPSTARVAAGAFGFLIFSHLGGWLGYLSAASIGAVLLT